MIEIEYQKSVVKLADNVYEPAEDSFLLADAVLQYAYDGMRIIEIGTGTGIVSAVIRANLNPEMIIATDINPYAARCAKGNGIDVIRTDLFKGIKRLPIFDLIIFNPPYLPTDDEKIEGWLNYAFDGGISGNDTVEDFLDNAGYYMSDDSSILMVTSSLADIKHIMNNMKDKDLCPEIVASTRYFFEEIVIIRATKKT
ncbi:methylase [Methanosalsum zhilinae DSM 4017]|uniref:Methylase n=1 Tax=Methanosalsum zhilinae (strain DSM 4017 / NBRC 107636 / OCM 62 / WeN5) TaxID=679901 RepID=F7XN13_METZD|nr:HemK2/MTQ2 family protein methyltransferase [Methanosalsum zhilinae]AEH61122.1 methylase [Methanosalsum zhilinae DSM 4017]